MPFSRLLYVTFASHLSVAPVAEGKNGEKSDTKLQDTNKGKRAQRSPHCSH